jgi:hypothetical protein
LTASRRGLTARSGLTASRRGLTASKSY